jgi:hypothetical protein
MGDIAKRTASVFGRLTDKRRQRKAERAERAHASGERKRRHIRDRKPGYEPGGGGGA